VQLNELIATIFTMLLIVLPFIFLIFTKHQQNMAAILRSNQAPQFNPEMAAMRQEIQELKQLIHQQAIMMDTFVSQPERAIQERVR